MTPKAVPWSQLRLHWTVYLFIFPAAALVGLFVYYPALSGIWHSFYRWNGADINEYCGLQNFHDLFKDTQFWTSFRVATVLGIWNVIKMAPALAVAVCIHRCRSEKLQFAYRILFVAPMVIPALIVTLIWRNFFFEATRGFLNRILFATHFFDVLVWLDAHLGWGGVFQAGHQPAWLGDGNLILFACIVWGFPWVGSFAVLTHLAKLQNIPKELYEAADLDGATWWSRFRRIELPLMMGSINILLVFVIIDTLKDAAMILALAGLEGGPGGVVTVPAIFMLRQAFVNQQMGSACAVGIVLTAIVMILKKALDGLSDWATLSHPKRTAYRAFCFALGATLYHFLDSHILGGLLILISLPLSIIWRWLIQIARLPKAPVTDAWTITPAQRQAAARMKLRDVSPAYHRRQKLEAIALRIGKHAFIWLTLATAYLPLYLMLVVSFKNNAQYYDNPAMPTAPYHGANWVSAWHLIIPSLANSIFITTSSTALTLLFALCGAYFFARVKVPGSSFLWNALLILMIMPTIANIVPLFVLLKHLSLLNTLSALVAVGAAGGQIFAIFVLRNFIADLPQDLFEAAEMDGASHFRQLFGIVAPLSGPILGVVGVMHAVGQWNDFVLPLLVEGDAANLPVMVQLIRMAGEYVKFWGPLMAGYTLASLPVIFLFTATMRLFTRGLTEGAVKG
jgi:ABC-type glycerol-3-phosphate transport system permease component